MFDNVAGTMIREIRRRTGLRQADLAARCGVARTVLSAYENGRRQPSVKSLAEILYKAGRFELSVHSNIDLARNGERLAELLELADALPFKGKPPLEYPKLP